MPDPFENMTEEQLLALIREAGREPKSGTEEKKPAADKASVRLADGSVLEATNAEELNKLLVARLSAEPAPRREEPKPTPAPTAPVSWDLKTFTEKFVTDPAEGIEYMETAKYGMPVSKTVPVLVALLGALGQKVAELETAQFAPQKPEERSAIDRIMKERNWQPSRQSYEDARDIAIARGFVKTEEKKPETADTRRSQSTPFIPPRTSRASGEEQSMNDEDLIRAANDMPIEKLEELLLNSGHIKARRT